MRHFIFLFGIVIFGCSFFQLHAQKKSDTSFTLLWYKGKKINDSTLLKTTGERVSFSPSQSSVSITYPEGKDPMTSIRNNITRSEEIKTQMDLQIIGSVQDARAPGLVVAANAGFDQAVKAVKEILENRFFLEEPAKEVTPQEKITRIKNWPPDISEAYHRVLDYVRRPDPGQSGKMVPPPSASYDYCFPCDEARKAAYTRDSLAFIKSFLSLETLNMNRATAVIAYMQKQKAPPGPDSLFSLDIRTQMYDAMVIIAERIENKLISVWNTFKNDHTKVPFLAEFLTRMARVHEMMGFKMRAGFPDMGILAATLAEIVKNVLLKAKSEMDYKILLNVQKIMYLFKFAGSLGLSFEEFADGISDYLSWTEFKVTVDAEAKLVAKEVTQMARLHFDGIFDAYPDSTCRLKWYAHGMDAAKGIVFDVKDIQVITPDGPATYTGTRQFAAKKPWLKLDFCDDSRDSALFYPFFPYNGKDTWTMGDLKDYPLHMVHSLFMTSFMDAASLKKRAMSMKQSDILEQMKSVYSQKVQPNTSDMNFNPATMKPKDYERAAKLMDAADEMIQITWYTSLYSFPVKGRLKNNQKIVFDETLNGKKISQVKNIEFANFKVKIEHAAQ